MRGRIGFLSYLFSISLLALLIFDKLAHKVMDYT